MSLKWSPSPSSLLTVSFHSDNGIASLPFSLSLSSLCETGRPKTAKKWGLLKLFFFHDPIEILSFSWSVVSLIVAIEKMPILKQLKNTWILSNLSFTMKTIVKRKCGKNQKTHFFNTILFVYNLRFVRCFNAILCELHRGWVSLLQCLVL